MVRYGPSVDDPNLGGKLYTVLNKSNFRTKILDADIDEFISNLSPDTSDMSDDSGSFHRLRGLYTFVSMSVSTQPWFETNKDFEFDEAILDKWVSQCKSETPENESLEFIFDIVIKNMPPAVQYPVMQVKR